MIEVRNISKIYKTGQKQENDLVALRNVSLQIKQGEFIALLGPSGCGKSTLLDLIAGLNTPSEGKILINNEHPLIPGKYSSMVFQSYSLIPWKSVKANIEHVLKIKKIPKDRWNSIIKNSLTEVDLHNFQNAYPKQLSGGMQQRVALARSLISDTQILLMDEPFAALDAITRENLQKLFIDLLKEKNKTIVFVTHSIDEALKMADRIVVFTNNPGEIKKIFNLPPRNHRDTLEKDLLVKVKREIFKILNKKQ